MKDAPPVPDPLEIAHRSNAGGTLWHVAVVALCVAGASVARAQSEPAGEPAPQGEGVAGAEGEAAGEPAPQGEGAAGAEREPRTEAEPGTGTEAEPGLGSGLAAPAVSAAVATPAVGAVEDEVPPAATPARRPRGWRLPRETVRRPLTLPQGVLRFDSIVALTMQPAATFSGSEVFMSASTAVAAGLHDDVEIGTAPLFGITWLPPAAFADPALYARVRALSGDVQLAFRAGTTLPVAGQLDVAQMELATELALLVLPWLRVDTGVDYGLRFSDPLHQRVGVPLVLTAQAGIHAVSLASAFFVFNDFDDVDVPLLLRYVVSFRGYQGPGGEWAFEGGFTDLEHAERAWIMQSRFTFFAYL